MKGINGVQMSLHPKFRDLFRKIQTDRIVNGKDSKSGENQLSDKRLSLTISKYFLSNPQAYNLILNAEIDKNES